MEVQSMLRKLPYIILYVTKAGITETSPEMADVLYQYPRSGLNSHQSAKLLKSRGLFITLCQALPEVSGGSKPVISSVSVDGSLVHVGVAEEREDVLLMALPASKCPAKHVSQLVRDIVRLLRLRYQSLANAFSISNQSEMDEFFGVCMLEELLNISSSIQQHPVKSFHDTGTRNLSRFEQALPACQWLNLPDEVKFQIDDAMSQFESADFQEYSEEFYDLPREFNILGSCLFHKGFLLGSHLARDDTVDVLLWCKAKKLAALTEQYAVHQIVSWNEIFPTSQSVKKPDG